MKMAVFWVVVPCSLVEVHRRFESTADSINKSKSKEEISDDCKDNIKQALRNTFPELNSLFSVFLLR
jgi:hypothetical protein